MIVTGGTKLGFEDDDDNGVGVGVGVLGSSGLGVVVSVGLSGRVLVGGVGVSLLVLSHDEPNRVWVGVVIVSTTGTVTRVVRRIELVTRN